MFKKYFTGLIKNFKFHVILYLPFWENKIDPWWSGSFGTFTCLLRKKSCVRLCEKNDIHHDHAATKTSFDLYFFREMDGLGVK